MAVLAFVGSDFSLERLFGMVLVFATSYGLYALYAGLTAQKPYPDIPLIDGEGGLWEGKKRFIMNSKEVVASAVRQAKGTVCQIYTDSGPRILLKPHHLEEIKNDENFSFTVLIEHEMLSKTFGFRQFSLGNDSSEVFKEVIKKPLTQSLAKLTVPLAEEAALAMARHFPPSKEWKQTPPLSPTLLELVSQLSGRAFLGLPICRNPDWLRISSSFTREFFIAIQAVRRFPPILRPLMFYLLPQVKVLRQTHATAHRIIAAELQSRREEKWKNGRVAKDLDALQWFDEAVEKSGRAGELDIINGQLGLTLAAINTTSNALTNVLLDLAGQPKLVDELREEIVQVLGRPPSDDHSNNNNNITGRTKAKHVADWQKASLQRLRLLDSVLKESQRLNPANSLAIRRVALRAATLSDGTHIPAGASTSFPTTYLYDRHLSFYSLPGHAPPDVFDGHRYKRLREESGRDPGDDHRWQFVATNVEHFGFGVGTHSCPGRFFASNELKIALVHALITYDWRYVSGGDAARPENITRVDQVIPNPTTRLEYRSREPEIEL